MQEHSYRLQVIQAGHDKDREAQVEALKRKLADRRIKRTRALEEKQEQQVRK